MGGGSFVDSLVQFKSDLRSNVDELYLKCAFLRESCDTMLSANFSAT